MTALRMFSPEGVRRYFANTSWMILERAISMGLKLLAVVLMARVLGPGDFGVLQYAMSFVGLFALVTTLGLDTIVTRELVRNPDRAGVLLGTSMGLRSAAAASMLVILALVTAVLGYRGTLALMIMVTGLASVPQVFAAFEWYFQARVLAKVAVSAHVASAAVAALLTGAACLLRLSVGYFAWLSVVEAIVAERLAFSAPPMLRTEEMVDEPLTARAEVVAEVAERPRTVVIPVLETLKRVLLTPVLEVEAMEKRFRRTEVEAAWTPKVAKAGVEEPTVRVPRFRVLPVVVAPPAMVSPPFCAPLPIVEEADEMNP